MKNEKDGIFICNCEKSISLFVALFLKVAAPDS